jgi:uncharacterized membrane protein
VRAWQDAPMPRPSSDDTRALGLAAVLGTAGVMHFVRPQFFDEIVPHRLPFPPRVWTYVSGVAELACAVAVARPATRKVGALAAAAVFVAVFPANIQMAIDWRSRAARDRVAAYGRLPLQLPLVLWARRVRNDAARAERSGT